MNSYETLRFYKESDVSSPIHKLNLEQIIEIMKKMGISFPILYMENKKKCPNLFLSDSKEMKIGDLKLRVYMGSVHNETGLNGALRIFSA